MLVIGRSVTSRYHAICIVEQLKEKYGLPFFPECNHTQETHTCHFFRFFFPVTFARPRRYSLLR